MDTRKRLLTLANRQGGYLRRDQLMEFESKPTVWRKIRSGEYAAVSDVAIRILELPGLLPLLRGAVLALPGAVVSHRSASALHGFPHVVERAEVTVPSHCTHVFENVGVHRTNDLTSASIVVINGLPVTSVARTVFDLAAVLRPRALDRVVEDLLVTRLTSLDDLKEVVGALGRRGKPGTQAMREILNRRGRGNYVPSTVLERSGMAILMSVPSIPEPVAEFPIPWSPNRRFDAAFPRYRIAIEWDSRRWHAALDRMESDRRRDRECAAHGWVLLRFTWSEVTERPDDVVASVFGVITGRDPTLGSGYQF